jgi:RNA polymerase sigma-70 factor, ECF subfamily
VTRAGTRSDDVHATLLRRAAEGDEAAFSRLAAQARPLMYRWALVQLLDADAAEDVAQRALLRMQRSLSSFRGDAAFTTWVYTIVRSATADWRRSERRRSAMHATEIARSAHEMFAVQSHAPPASGLIDVVRRHMKDLPARQREVFDLVDMQSQSPQDAAALLSMHPVTVRVHLMRARRAIRARLIAHNATLVEDRI